MAVSIRWISHVESYVSSSSTASQQGASLDAIAALLKSDSLSLEALVREMEMYLTTSDSNIRSRGILLLGELLSTLVSKPLDATVLRTLIRFFTERLADWKALRGALVGCLALLRRKVDVGTVGDTEAKAVAHSHLQNLQVQSLGQHDRMLSFQLMECLLDHYPCAIADMGDHFFYGVLEAIDGEKDPQCLLSVFHIVESLSRLYPGPASSLENHAEDIFEILGSYFPIHLTHTKDENDDLMTEELSRALMMAFASTPYFEPFCIPLLLEKLSSSLSLAKLDSFRYLCHCVVKYGKSRMVRHSAALWSSIKDAVYFSPDSVLSVDSEFGAMNFVESDIMVNAFMLLREVILQNDDFIHLVVEDSEINIFIDSLNHYSDFDDIPFSVKQRLHSVGHILSTCAELSSASCNKVFEHFFPLLMVGLGISATKPSEVEYLYGNCSHIKHRFGSLYLSTNILAACRDLAVSVDDISSPPDHTNHTWCSMLNIFFHPMFLAFLSVVKSDILHRHFVCLGVNGLVSLATFPGSLPSVPEFIYAKILSSFLEILTGEGIKEFVWKLALRALIDIGLYINKCWGSAKALTFETAVVEKIASIISSDDTTLPLSLKLQVAFEIGELRMDFMTRIVRALDEAINTSINAVCVHGNHECIDVIVKLLDGYCERILPWSIKNGDSQDIPLNLALRIWGMVENNSPPQDMLSAISIAMKKAVSYCSERSQETIINKAAPILASCATWNLVESISGNSCMQGYPQYMCAVRKFSSRDECLLSLFAAVVIALHPQTIIPNGEFTVHLFMLGVLNGHIPSAHALGSFINKLPLVTSEIDSVGIFSLNEALGIVFNSFTRTSLYSGIDNDTNRIKLARLKLKSLGVESLINIIKGLAWIGKGLLLRGHEQLKDVSLTLLSFLTWDHRVGGLNVVQYLNDAFVDEDSHLLRKCAADAFHIIMGESEECLNQSYYAIVKPLYKQRFFSSIIPILIPLVKKSESSLARYLVYRAFAHIVSNTPLAAVLGEARKLVPAVLECLSMLVKAALDKEITYNVLLVLSSMLLENSGYEAVVENIPSLVHLLVELTAYPHMMGIRETAIQCLVAVSELPHTRIYPMRSKVLRAISKALDDPKRIVRQEAVRCRQAW